MSDKRVLSAGQCMADHGSISRTVQSLFGASVVPVRTTSEALDQLRQGPFALVLVNRIFDADGSAGLDLIQQIKADPALAEVPVMLVSNYDDAQAEAVAAGAVPGFGKAALHNPALRERLRPYLE